MTRDVSTICLLLTCAALLTSCTAVMSYDEVLHAAKAVDFADGVDRDEAVLLAQRHVILTGLDQDVSVWHVAEAQMHPPQNAWHVFFRTGLDNKVGDRRGEKVDQIIVAVDAKTGAVARIIQP